MADPSALEGMLDQSGNPTKSTIKTRESRRRRGEKASQITSLKQARGSVKTVLTAIGLFP